MINDQLRYPLGQSSLAALVENRDYWLSQIEKAELQLSRKRERSEVSQGLAADIRSMAKIVQQYDAAITAMVAHKLNPKGDKHE